MEAMGTKVLISEEEYLRTAYENPEPEYRDGELIERSGPTFTHGDVLRRFGVCFHNHTVEGQRLIAVQDVRVRTRPGRYPLPDMIVVKDKRPVEEYPTTPPLIAIEVLSPDDSMYETTSKLAEYWNWGCPHVWLVDPRQQKLYAYGPGDLHFVTSFQIPGEDWSITPADLFDAPSS